LIIDECLIFNADVAKLADAPDLGSGGAIHVGSIPIIRTIADLEFFIADGTADG
jgi:hypothetical protein